MGGIICALAILVWWAFFSRVPHLERWGALAITVAAMFATSFIIHASIANGAMGMLFPINAIQGVSLALVVWALLIRHVSGGLRRASLVAAILIA